MNKFQSGLLLIICTMTLATSVIATSFTSDLTYAVAQESSAENVVISPISIKSSLVLAYLGAENDTATEIKNVLQLSTSNREDIAKEFGQLIAKAKNSVSAKLKIVNRIYIADQYSLAPEFNELANKYFDSAAEKITFSDSTLAANKINAWVKENTNNKIQNLIDPSILEANTAVVLVNAIYFKAEWLHPFSKFLTSKQNFSVSTTRKVQVDMMMQRDAFLYADLHDLDAVAVELPYKNSDLTMLIVLPKEIDGLHSLETKLKDVDITNISDKFEEMDVDLSMPKFKIDFDVELENVLKKLGLNLMFTDAADFSRLFVKGKQSKIDKFKHKAFIEVTEAGTEAAGATFAKRSGYSYTTYLKVDHPFFFAIKDNKNVYFAGHVKVL